MQVLTLSKILHNTHPTDKTAQVVYEADRVYEVDDKHGEQWIGNGAAREVQSGNTASDPQQTASENTQTSSAGPTDEDIADL